MAGKRVKPIKLTRSDFPNDENGDVLWRMYGSGDDLSKPRQIDYSVIFPTREMALKFGTHLLKQGQPVRLSKYPNKKMPWEITVMPIFAPTHHNITQYETLLAHDSAKFNGRNDGWGCLQQD
jgi:hypothetical protein